MVYLETKRLILRDYKECDKESYIALKSDQKTMYYLQDIQCTSKEDGQKDFIHVLQDMGSKHRRFYFLAIELKETHEQIGSIGYTVKANTPEGKIVDAGYFMYPAFWHQGYGTEAFHRIIEYAFLENNVYRITTGCLKENIGSRRVMEKCGLIKEAEHIDYQWHDGKFKTRLEYRLIKTEWKR